MFLLIIGPSYTIRKKKKSTKLNSLSLIKIMVCVDCLILDFVSFTSSLFYKSKGDQPFSDADTLLYIVCSSLSHLKVSFSY